MTYPTRSPRVSKDSLVLLDPPTSLNAQVSEDRGFTGSLIDKDGVEVDVPQYAGSRAGTSGENDPSFLDSLHRLLHESRVVGDASAETRVNRELLQVLVDFGAFRRGTDYLVLLEELT